jgi:hypothetical protein
MSGPIVRKYGFPNFDKIFGTREVEHGVDEPEQTRPTEPEGTGLPPDKAHQPVDPNRPDSAGKMAPATEFGRTSD